MKLYTTLLLLFIVNIVNSQLHHDCIDALEVCSDITLTNTAGPGDITEDITFCNLTDAFLEDLVQSNSTWLKYTVESAGLFAFTIIPPEDGDIDFIVYTSTDGSCNSLVSQRCMFSGETQGQPSTPCLGNTGLDFESTDTIEGSGCNDGSDNFLAALEVEGGDVVFLAVIDFSQTSLPMEIDYTGTAELCEPLSSSEKNKESIKIYPNPTRDVINIDTDDLLEAKISLVNTDGKIIFDAILVPEQIDISKYRPGVYYLIVEDELSRLVQKLIKL